MQKVCAYCCRCAKPGVDNSIVDKSVAVATVALRIGRMIGRMGGPPGCERGARLVLFTWVPGTRVCKRHQGRHACFFSPKVLTLCLAHGPYDRRSLSAHA